MTLLSITILFSFISSGFGETIFCLSNNDCANILRECDLFRCRIVMWRVIVLAAVIFTVIFIIFGVSYFIFWTCSCSNRNAPNNRFVPPQTLYQTNRTNWPQTYSPNATNWPPNAINWPQVYHPNVTNWTQTYSTNVTNWPMDSSNTTNLPETDSPNETNWPKIGTHSTSTKMTNKNSSEIY